MHLRVHVPHLPHGAFREHLERAIAPEVELQPGPDLPERADFEILVTGVPTREQLDASARLRALVIPYAGLPARTRELLADYPQLAVHNLHHNAAPTAELALALLLATARRLVPLDRELRAHDWRSRYDERASGMLLEGRRALVLGHGHIGRRVARACAALGMQVDALRARPQASAVEDDGIRVHSGDALQHLLPGASVLISCLPATPQTEGLLGAAEIQRLPSGAIVVNVGRASVIDERALFEALRDGHLGGAGLDCWYRYPEDEAARACTPPAELPFWELDHVVLSPHRAGHSDRTEELRATHLAALLNQAARGEPMPDRVDVQRGY